MSILIIAPDRNTEKWIQALKKIDSQVSIYGYTEEVEKEEVEFILCWNHPYGVFSQYPNLKCISSMGAGVDHMLKDPDLPEKVDIVRLVDPQLQESMYQYVFTVAMMYLRNFDQYIQFKIQSHWKPVRPIKVSDFNIGIMGLGKLGAFTVRKLVEYGFKVSGWSRSKKEIDSVTTFHEEVEKESFLSNLNMLVCMLPLTEETENILNKGLFKMLPKGAILVNVGRGEHLVEQDLVEFLDNGHLKGACLDVFREEPLPVGHVFWKHEKVTITPHCSSITDPFEAAAQIIENYHRMKKGKKLLNQVDPVKGY